MNRRQTFERIWRTNAWRGTETKAGPGSTLHATRSLRALLPEVMGRLGITSVLDAGCSEGWWMPDLPGYVGVDIVPAALDVAREHHPDRTYELGDICADPLPRIDAVICRDALQHMSLLDGLAALQNFRRAGAWVLFAGTHHGEENRDIRTGAFYRINVQAAPFWLGSPVWAIKDGSWDDTEPYPQKMFGAWRLV